MTDVHAREFQVYRRRQCQPSFANTTIISVAFTNDGKLLVHNCYIIIRSFKWRTKCVQPAAEVEPATSWSCVEHATKRNTVYFTCPNNVPSSALALSINMPH